MPYGKMNWTLTTMEELLRQNPGRGMVMDSQVLVLQECRFLKENYHPPHKAIGTAIPSDESGARSGWLPPGKTPVAVEMSTRIFAALSSYALLAGAGPSFRCPVACCYRAFFICTIPACPICMCEFSRTVKIPLKASRKAKLANRGPR